MSDAYTVVSSAVGKSCTGRSKCVAGCTLISKDAIGTGCRSKGNSCVVAGKDVVCSDGVVSCGTGEGYVDGTNRYKGGGNNVAFGPIVSSCN